jgi:F-type H+-transporting ATPase subunit b
MALLRVDPGLVIWLWITFGIVLLILRLTVWDTITGALDKRSQKVASDLEAGRLANEKAGVVLAQYDQTIKDGKLEAARIIEEARGQAARLREDVLQQSHEESRELRKKAMEEIQRAQEDAEKALRGQLVTLSFSIANAILKRETATADNRAFVEEFAEKLGSAGASQGGTGSGAPGAPSRN